MRPTRDVGRREGGMEIDLVKRAQVPFVPSPRLACMASAARLPGNLFRLGRASLPRGDPPEFHRNVLLFTGGYVAVRWPSPAQCAHSNPAVRPDIEPGLASSARSFFGLHRRDGACLQTYFSGAIRRRHRYPTPGVEKLESRDRRAASNWPPIARCCSSLVAARAPVPQCAVSLTSRSSGTNQVVHISGALDGRSAGRPRALNLSRPAIIMSTPTCTKKWRRSGLGHLALSRAGASPGRVSLFGLPAIWSPTRMPGVTRS